MKRRSQCHCMCHRPGVKVMHVAACCEPDVYVVPIVPLPQPEDDDGDEV